MGGLLLLISIFDAVSLADFTNIAGLQQSQAVYATGTFKEITVQRLADWSMSNTYSTFFLYIIMILPLMMIGAGQLSSIGLSKQTNKRKNGYLFCSLRYHLD